MADDKPTVINSIIDYGNIFIHTCSAQDLHGLQILQNSALRCFYNVSDTRDQQHVSDLHKNATVEMMDIRRKKKKTLMYLEKCLIWVYLIILSR